MILPPDTETRKLAAIMFTDIKGFSKKMAENETVAFELLKTHDALLRVLTAKFDGRVIKSLGDSFMIDFPSAVNAVRCAIEAQKRFWHFNKGKSEFQMIEIRVGIHLGDVIIRSDDIIGDGVNVASRIEAMAEPNRIWISQDVYQQVRNKIPLEVFALGPQRLKNIPEPVEVYEILIENIPEFSRPSATALETKKSNREDQAVQREAEEAHEARSIEEVKRRVKKDSEKEEERKKQIAEHYAKAEKYFDQGMLEEAEKELMVVYDLDPQQRIIAERKLAEQENEKAVQAHLSKARELLTKGQLDAAENEVNEVFHQFPLHVGAQGILLEIEEERYRQEEQQRTKRLEEQPKVITEEERRINELLDRARTEMQQEKFSEATFTLHELFRIDPNHSGARRLEENLRQAKQAKEELSHIQAEHAEEEKRLQELANLQRRLEERRKRKKRTTEQVFRKIQYKRIIYTTLAVFGLAVVIFNIPRLIDWIFPKTASIAVLHFTNSSNQISTLDISEALPIFLADDFMRCEHLSTIASSTSLSYDTDPEQFQKIASSLPVEYLLTGTVQENNGRYSISLRLFSSEQNQIINLGTVEGSLPTLNHVRRTIVRTVLSRIEVKSALPEFEQPSNIDAFSKYIESIHLLQLGTSTSIETGAKVLQDAVSIDTVFNLAYGILANTELRMFKTNEDHRTLRLAMDYARQALSGSPDNALAYQVLGTGYRFTRQYEMALSSLTKCLEYLPQNPECYRELALLALIAGKYDDALKYASNAMARDPQNSDSHFTLGLVRNMKKDYWAAVKSYQQAQRLNSTDSLTLLPYLIDAWINLGQHETAIRYYQDVFSTLPKDYQYYYWIGRAYQLAVKVSPAQQWLQEGLALTQKHIDTNPNDSRAYMYAGLFQSRLGKFAEGEAALNRAMQYDSTSAEVLFRSAALYSIQRNKQKAMSSLIKGLKKRYDFSELLDVDLMFIANEPEFLPNVTEEIKGIWPTK